MRVRMMIITHVGALSIKVPCAAIINASVPKPTTIPSNIAHHKGKNIENRNVAAYMTAPPVAKKVSAHKRPQPCRASFSKCVSGVPSSLLIKRL